MTRLLFGHVQANGLKLHYYRTDDQKPAVILLHGFSDSGLCWGRLALTLERSYDVIMPDARGHGLSGSPLNDTHTHDDHASDVKALIQDLELQKPFLIGHSMGAQTAALVAARYPDFIGGTVLEDPPFFDNAMAPSPEELKQRTEKVRLNLVGFTQQTLDELISKCEVDHPNWDPEDRKEWAAAKMQMNPGSAVIMTLRPIPWKEIIPKINCPTLLITGDPERGALVTPAVAAEMAGLSKNIEILNIPGSGHSIRRDQFNLYLAGVMDFLKKHRQK